MGAFSAEPLSGVNSEQLERKYRWSVQFLKEKEGTVLHLPYNSRVLLAALCKQVSKGCFDQQMQNDDVGFLDRFGQDRNNAWRVLGQMDRYEAMKKFVDQLEQLCPEMEVFYETATAAQLPVADRQHVAAAAAIDCQNVAAEAQIRQLLNEQTLQQFTAYANQQHPGDATAQRALIKQLQHDHYQEYVAQLSNSRAQQHRPIMMQATAHTCSQSVDTVAGGENNAEQQRRPAAILQPASIWTRRDIDQFKQSVRAEPNGVIHVGSSETVTVRVPTHEDGSCLFWEFATDRYDIAFGLFFEWTVTPDVTVSVHVSEADEDDDDEDDEDGNDGASSKFVGDLERGGNKASGVSDEKPQIDQIVPLYRRDCHEDVHAGSHVYPGRGVYLLKFDNSYSLWRSKTLYYRVYYSK